MLAMMEALISNRLRDAALVTKGIKLVIEAILLSRNFAIEGLGTYLSGNCAGTDSYDAAFRGADIPKWSYAKLIKWLITVLTASGIVVYVANLDRNHIFTNILIAFVLLLILSCLCLFVISWRVKNGLIWQEGIQRDGTHNWKSIINAFAFMCAFSLMCFSSSTLVYPIAESIRNMGPVFLDWVMQVLRETFTALDAGNPLPFAIAFLLTVFVGSILLCVGVRMRKFTLPKMVECAVRSIFRERSYLQFPSFVFMALGALIMLCLPVAMLVGIIADTISFGVGESLGSNQVVLLLIFVASGLVLVRGGFCYTSRGKQI